MTFDPASYLPNRAIYIDFDLGFSRDTAERLAVSREKPDMRPTHCNKGEKQGKYTAFIAGYHQNHFFELRCDQSNVFVNNSIAFGFWFGMNIFASLPHNSLFGSR